MGFATLAATKDKEFAGLCAEVKIESAELGLTQIVNYDGYDYDEEDAVFGILLC